MPEKTPPPLTPVQVCILALLSINITDLPALATALAFTASAPLRQHTALSHLRDLAKRGLIRPSRSSWQSSPITLTPAGARALSVAMLFTTPPRSPVPRTPHRA